MPKKNKINLKKLSVEIVQGILFSKDSDNKKVDVEKDLLPLWNEAKTPVIVNGKPTPTITYIRNTSDFIIREVLSRYAIKEYPLVLKKLEEWDAKHKYPVSYKDTNGKGHRLKYDDRLSFPNNSLFTVKSLCRKMSLSYPELKSIRVEPAILKQFRLSKTEEQQWLSNKNLRDTTKHESPIVIPNAQEFLDYMGGWLNSTSYLEQGLALALMCGRRSIEVFVLGKFKKLGLNTLTFSGRAKGGKNVQDNTEYEIPILCDSVDFIKAFNDFRSKLSKMGRIDQIKEGLREYKTLEGDESDDDESDDDENADNKVEIEKLEVSKPKKGETVFKRSSTDDVSKLFNTTFAHNLNEIMKQISLKFDIKIHVHSLRAIYAKMCWSLYERKLLSKDLKGKKLTSSAFVKKILIHKDTQSARAYETCVIQNLDHTFDMTKIADPEDDEIDRKIAELIKLKEQRAKHKNLLKEGNFQAQLFTEKNLKSNI